MLLGGMVGVVGPTLVVEIVQQRRQAPELFIGAKLARIGAHAGFHRQRMLAQVLVLCVLAQQGPGVVATRHRWSSRKEPFSATSICNSTRPDTPAFFPGMKEKP